jgi:hypothetical protein
VRSRLKEGVLRLGAMLHRNMRGNCSGLRQGRLSRADAGGKVRSRNRSLVAASGGTRRVSDAQPNRARVRFAPDHDLTQAVIDAAMLAQRHSGGRDHQNAIGN